MSKRSAWFLSFLLAFPLAACGVTSPLGRGAEHSTVSDDDYVQSTAPIAGADLDALWERAGQVLTFDGYAADSLKTHFADHEIVTLWNPVLGMNRYEGYRTRAWVRFKKAENGRWTPAVAVQRQRNGDIRDPSELALAQWEDQPADKSRATAILWKIESAFRVAGGDDASPK